MTTISQREPTSDAPSDLWRSVRKSCNRGFIAVTALPRCLLRRLRHYAGAKGAPSLRGSKGGSVTTREQRGLRHYAGAKGAPSLRGSKANVPARLEGKELKRPCAALRS